MKGITEGKSCLKRIVAVPGVKAELYIVFDPRLLSKQASAGDSNREVNLIVTLLPALIESLVATTKLSR